MAPRALEIIDIAQEHGGRFLLPQRFDRRPVGTVPNPDKDEIDWEACSALVANEWARWLPSGSSWECALGPGIELTSRVSAHG